MDRALAIAIEHDPVERALWHLELLGCWGPEDAVAPWSPPIFAAEDDYDDDYDDE